MHKLFSFEIYIVTGEKEGKDRPEWHQTRMFKGVILPSHCTATKIMNRNWGSVVRFISHLLFNVGCGVVMQVSKRLQNFLFIIYMQF